MNAAPPPAARRPAAEPTYEEHEPDHEEPARGGKTPEDDIPF